VLGAGHAEDEGDAVAGEERTRRPHDHAPLLQLDRELDHGAGAERDEDLGDRELEVERDLPEHLQRDDHRGEVETRIGQARQEHRVGSAADHERAAA
jgi:hypothetical protein